MPTAADAAGAAVLVVELVSGVGMDYIRAFVTK